MGEQLSEGFIGLHIGAGSHSARLHAQYKHLCRRACRQGAALLSQGKSALDVAEAVTATLENSPLTNAGLGSSLTWDGKVECDASIMEGGSGRWGGVGAVPGVRNPVQLARALCDKQGTTLALGRVPPCLLVGLGAKKWAQKAGIETVSCSSLITDRALKLHRHYKKKVAKFEVLTGKVLSPLDTVGVVCCDKRGSVAAACSSGGIVLKHSGRVGQAGSYGSGVWAEDGPTAVAVCSSGCGEHLMRTMLAKEVAEDVRNAECPTSALYASIKNKFVDSPYLTGVTEALGGVAVLRVSDSGAGEFLWGHTTATMCLGFVATTPDCQPRARISALEGLPGTAVVIEGTSFALRRDVAATADIPTSL